MLGIQIQQWNKNNDITTANSWLVGYFSGTQKLNISLKKLSQSFFRNQKTSKEGLWLTAKQWLNFVKQIQKNKKWNNI